MPNADVLAPIQLALYDRLTGDATLMALVTGVYDHVPEGAAFPYVVIGEAVATGRGQGLLATHGRSTVVALHVWDSRRGFGRPLQVVDHLVRLLDRQPLDLDGHHCIAVRHVQTVTLRDPDFDLRHVTARFDVVTNQQT